MTLDWRDDPELGQMVAAGIDYRGRLADEQVTGTMQRKATRPIAVRLAWIAPPNLGSLSRAHIHGTHVPCGGGVPPRAFRSAVAGRGPSLPKML